MSHQYRHYAEVQQAMRGIVCACRTLPPDAQAGALAFVTRQGGAGRCYCIYTSPHCAGQSFLMHEAGHIIFQHLRFEETLRAQVLARVRGAWAGFKSYLSYRAADEEDALESLVRLLSNYAMDMEVNSKLFDADERAALTADLSRAEHRRLAALAKSDSPLRAAAARALARHAADPDAPLAAPILPEDYGFARGLNWLSYIDLIIQHPHAVMPQLCERLRRRQAPGGAAQGRLPAAVIRQAAQAADVAGARNASLASGGNGAGRGGACGRTRQRTVQKLGAEVRAFITERAVAERAESRADYLYLANRGKAAGVLRAKTVERAGCAPGNVYLIVDTSGSVPESQLAKLLALFAELGPRVGAKSKVIFWDTRLQRTERLRARIGEIPRGGGTDLAPAISYAAERYCTRDDRLFIISDYCDDLAAWRAAAQKLRCPCYGICWTRAEPRTQARMALAAQSEFCRAVETLFVHAD